MSMAVVLQNVRFRFFRSQSYCFEASSDPSGRGGTNRRHGQNFRRGYVEYCSILFAPRYSPAQRLCSPTTTTVLESSLEDDSGAPPSFHVSCGHHKTGVPPRHASRAPGEPVLTNKLSGPASARAAAIVVVLNASSHSSVEARRRRCAATP